mmetsp:Transcript_821/g.1263  ORF Transcript_821/g.1263 Transcript_821/m.1263 type:complete len:381 (+) Transcript_821:103-1245(+)|eukprot:CAMPEP_0194203900 /NCGR_PEP_ID=MMETSP0156-20130528/3553_1 /TAXON_ID=33649 /ORGANISM="Thalassionema nitzschioides, Strain L26-B" /LENGTH=380 /DNA_ID=CAMNT_0038929753 /DNA_START=44 /DNA_END=1186 /DNA_ORIENTATION=-
MAINPNQSLPEWDRLLAACQKNQADIVRILIEEEGVNPSHANRVGQSALHIAALWGHVECVEILLRLGADVHATNKITGATPLHCAIQSSKASTIENRIEVVKVLLTQGGADPGLEDSYGRIPYDYLVPEEEEGTDLSELLQPQMPPLFAAIRDMKVDEVKEILEESRKTSVTMINPFSLTVVQFLQHIKEENVEASTKTLKVIELLVNHGCPLDEASSTSKRQNVDPTFRRDEPPCHQICLALKSRYSQLSDGKIDDDEMSANLREAARLLYCHSKANSATEALIPETEHLLHDSARRGNLKMAIFLIETLEIDPNVQGRQGMTPLHFAARSGQIEMVKHLIKKCGVDLKITDDRGKRALDAAMTNNREEIIAFLREHS